MTVPSRSNVDPRDTGWELEPVAFRVTAWSSSSASAEHEFSDLSGALSWISENSQFYRLTLDALVDLKIGTGRVRLIGGLDS